jgi:glycosidase
MAIQEVKHPSLFEVNTRVLVNLYSTDDRRATLKDIPDAYWQELANRNINWVWLMGVWQLTEKSINPEVIPEEMMHDFKSLVPDISSEDIDGSTFAIDDYVVDPVLGGAEELAVIREKLAQLGMKLMLDFVPNHYGAHTHWLRTHPEYFIEVGDSAHEIDPKTFYSPLTMSNKFFAHGKDPYFEAWQDTVQVDYTFDGTREWMANQLLKVAEHCDGARCDMAMLPIKRIFEKTWGNYVNWNGDEFWPDAIRQVKEFKPGFKLLAEVYWDMEAELLDAGFDWCYDKTFSDRLVDPISLKAHFNADIWYLERTARFLENHDEPRVASKMDVRKHMAAAAMVAFSPGLRFWHMGQWKGYIHRIPVQTIRQPQESCGCLLWNESRDYCQCLWQFYETLFDVVDRDVFRDGAWRQIPTPRDAAEKLFIWEWSDESEKILVVINFNQESLKFDDSTLNLPGMNFKQRLFPKPLEGQVDCPILKPWDVRLYKQ